MTYCREKISPHLPSSTTRTTLPESAQGHCSQHREYESAGTGNTAVSVSRHWLSQSPWSLMTFCEHSETLRQEARKSLVFSVIETKNSHFA